MNITELRKAKPQKAGLEVPSSLPHRILANICARRSQSLISGVPIARPSTEAWARFLTSALAATRSHLSNRIEDRPRVRSPAATSRFGWRSVSKSRPTRAH